MARPPGNGSIAVYLVRMQDSGELMGLYLAPSIEALCDMIDECCSPQGCEYIEMPPGGIYWPGKAPTLPKKADQSFGQLAWDSVTTERWSGIFGGYDLPKVWQPVVPPGFKYNGEIVPDTVEESLGP